jgi:hypothetical protein
VLVVDGLAALQLAREHLDNLESRLLQLGHSDLGLPWIRLSATCDRDKLATRRWAAP